MIKSQGSYSQFKQKQKARATFLANTLRKEKMGYEITCEKHIAAFLDNPSGGTQQKAKDALESFLDQYNRYILPLIPPSF